MSNPQEKMQTKFEELKVKLKSVRIVPTLNESTVRSFCIGFYLPLIGSLAYLKQQTSAYQKISCTAKIEHSNTFIINDHLDYDDFAKGLEKIIAPTLVDFTFNLTQSTYSIGKIEINDIHVTFTVYFQKENYDLVYVENGMEVLRYTKTYDQDLEPSEIVIIRDRICNYIFDRVTENMEWALSQI